MDVKKKIMFIVPSMRAGGAQRVMSILLNHLSRTKYDIILVLIRKEGKYLDDLPNDITIIDLDARGVRYAIFKIINMIKKFQPDIAFSTQGYLNLIISIIRPFLSKKTKFIARETSTVSMSNKNKKYPKLYDYLYKTFYNNFDLIICQSEYMRNDLLNNFNIKKEKMVVINNPVRTDYINSKSDQSNELLFNENKVNLLAASRLNHSKGYDLLLHAIAKLDQNYHLTIVAEGEEEDNIKTLISKLNINNKVTLAGFQANPYKYMKQSNIFILSSRYEGLPNVVLEANTCGTPVVAFDCPGGTGEIIEDGINGFLCECGNINELAEKINKASLHSFDKNKIKSLIRNKYDVNTIIIHYEKILS